MKIEDKAKDTMARKLPSTRRGTTAMPGKKTLLRHLSDIVRDGREQEALVETELLILSFATGIQDATSFPDYRCFASNQTGNTVLLAVAAAGLSSGSFDVGNTGVSLGVFVSSCLLMGQLGNLMGPRRRWWLITTNLFSTALVFVAAGLQYAIRVEESGATSFGVITLLAFSSGAQVAMARPLHVPQITTAMATSAYVDLLVDADLWKFRNFQRDRRVLFLSMLTVGSFVGAFTRARVNSALALILCAVLKLIVSGLFLLNATE